MTIAEIIGVVIRGAIGLSVGFGALFLIYYRNSRYWRSLAEQYGRPWYRPLAKRTMQHGVTYGSGDIASRSYNGILTIGVHDTGVALRVMFPFSMFHEPVFIPYADIRGWKQLWYVNAKSLELEFRKAPGVKLVMPASQVKWIQQQADGQLDLREENSPHRDRPDFWYAVIVAQGLMSVGLLGWLFWSGRIPFPG